MRVEDGLDLKVVYFSVDVDNKDLIFMGEDVLSWYICLKTSLSRVTISEQLSVTNRRIIKVLAKFINYINLFQIPSP